MYFTVMSPTDHTVL